MRLFVDENIPLITVQTLLNQGHDILDIRGTNEEGLPDALVWQKAQNDQRLFISIDKGFSNYRNAPHSGILLVCLKQPNRQKIHQRVMTAIREFDPGQWPGLLVVMRDTVQSVWRFP